MMSYVQNTLDQASLPLVLIAAVFAGAISSLSSCALAKLPVMWGYIAVAAESRKKGILLSVAFACGLIASYTMIGFLLGIVGDLVGQLVEISRYLYLVLGILLIMGGLLFSGLLPAGNSWFNKQCDATIRQTKNLHSAFLFGFLFALIEMPACPCCGAVIMVIASLAVMKGSLLFSGLIFLCFAIGQSLPLLIIGSSTSFIKHLAPRMERITGAISFVAGNIMIVSGIFFIMIA